MDSPKWSAEQRQAALDRGPHKSANEHREFLREEFVDFVRKGFWAVLPAYDVMDLDDLRLSPSGAVGQRARRPRFICDYTWYLINQLTLKYAPEDAMQFGRALIRIIQRIVYADPRFGPVYMAKYDLKDGFYRVQLHPSTIPRLAVILPRWEGETQLIAFPLTLPMGWTESPPYFCAPTETIADLANAALRLHKTFPPHRLEHYAKPDTLHAREDIASRPFNRSRDPLSDLLRYIDVYIDDLVGLAQGEADELEIMPRAVLHSTDDVFRPLHPDDHPAREEPVSLKKLRQGDGRLATRKLILGWILDTLRYTLELPEHKYSRLQEILNEYPRSRQRVSVKAWRQVLGELRAMSIALPGSRGLFGPLQAVLKPDQKRLRLTQDAHDFLDDFRWIVESIYVRPTSLFEIVPAPPLVVGTTDASGHGMGGVFFVPTDTSTADSPDYESYFWRTKFPPEIVSQLVTRDNPHGNITNSDLELAASIAQHDVIAHTVHIEYATIFTAHDNTPTVYWNRKGSTTTTKPAAYLLRLQALHRRHYRYYPEHDFIPGTLNAMSDDTSRMHSLTSLAFRSHLASTYPQRRPWLECTLRSELNSSLILALSRKRCKPESWSSKPSAPTTSGTCGWSSVPSTPWIPGSKKTTILYRTSKFSALGTAMDESHPVANPFDVAQLRRPFVMSDRDTVAWGPRTSDTTPSDESTSVSADN